MPRPPALRRGGPREQAFLDAIRQGHTRRAAAAAAGVSERTYQRHLERSPAFRNDLDQAENEAQRRLVNLVVESAVGGNAKSAQWLLERRWPNEFRQPTGVEISGRLDGGMEAAVLLVHRLQSMSPAELEAEYRALGWVDGEPPPDDAPRPAVLPDMPSSALVPAPRPHPAPMPDRARDTAQEPPLLRGMLLNPADVLDAIPDA